MLSEVGENWNDPILSQIPTPLLILPFSFMEKEKQLHKKVILRISAKKKKN